MRTSEVRQPPIKWFVAGPGLPKDILSDNCSDARSLVHAKCMGTLTSACGLSASSWTKFWHIPFSVTPTARQCPRCRAVVKFR